MMTAMRSAALLLVLALGGCTIGAGPTMGYRRGRATAGWEIDTGIIGYDQTTGGAGTLDVGQSWREGKHTTYFTASMMRMRLDEDQRFIGVGGSLGYGGGNDGDSHLVGGVAPLTGRLWGEQCSGSSDGWMATFSIGVRAIAGDVEVYVSPRVALVAIPDFCPVEDGGDF